MMIQKSQQIVAKLLLCVLSVSISHSGRLDICKGSVIANNICKLSSQAGPRTALHTISSLPL